MLNAMPRLRGIKVANSEIGSVAWAIFHTILTTPQLRSFEVKGNIYRHNDLRTQTDLPFAPLETFHYCPLVYNKPSYSQLEEMKLLSNTLSKVSGSLVTLVLPAECFSFDTMRHGDWPNLREIRIAGYERRFCMSDTDLVSVLGHISRLRVLSFDLAVADEDELKPLWPAHTQRATFPWPELESISLTWVHLDETIFSHLPRTCRHLSLRSWPRPYNYYRIRDDTALLEFVASTFPHLRKLRLIRYRSESDQERVPVRDIVGHFSSMQALRVLELYLDIEHVTLPREERPSFDEFCRILDVAIADIASALCSSVVSVRLITAEDSGLARWRYYRPIRAHGKSSAPIDTNHYMLRTSYTRNVYIISLAMRPLVMFSESSRRVALRHKRPVHASSLGAATFAFVLGAPKPSSPGPAPSESSGPSAKSAGSSPELSTDPSTEASGPSPSSEAAAGSPPELSTDPSTEASGPFHRQKQQQQGHRSKRYQESRPKQQEHPRHLSRRHQQGQENPRRSHHRQR
ncbi:hypothetical protein NUW54_g8510 [Trametes sanguinea]|uniref:Uncharacterized protein n=1 Tax=Trametes sanguinea TaxID=158606 RepID=A0ACC1PCV2_9APHY|nr:hypothetical protein NUW54_g8510 [Trametes sanguinea]